MKNIQTGILHLPLVAVVLVLAILFGGCESDCNDSCTPLTPEVRPPVLAVPLRDLEIPYHTNSSFFLVGNTGGEILNWTAVCLADFIELERTSGTVNGGTSQEIEIFINRNSMPNGISTATIQVSSENGHRAEIDIEVAHYANEYEILPYHVAAAAFDRNGNKLLVLADDPPRLHVRWPLYNSSDIVDLQLNPTKLAVSPDGSTAFIGHAPFGESTYISVVNLNTREVEEVFESELGRFGALAVAPNGWVYAFPASSYSHTMSSFAPETREESQISSRSSQSTLVHISGDYLYSADSGITPNSLHKYDIRDGVASYMYSDPHHANGEAFGRVWASDDGLFLYGWMGDVYTASTDQNHDMYMDDVMSGLGVYPTRARCIEQSTAAGRVFGADEKSNTILTYAYPDNSSLDPIVLPPFYIPDTDGTIESKEVWVHSLFTNSAGTQLFIIAQLEAGYDERPVWVYLERGL